MSSVDVLQDDNNSSDSFSLGDFSLLHEVGEPFVNRHANHINFDFTNLHSTLNETAYESAEVGSQITKLFSNTLSMKETLDRTNLMMKEELNNLPGLIDSKLEQQKQNLQKAEEKVSSLERENAMLLNKLDSLLGKFQNTEVKDICIKCETLETAVNTLFGEKDFIKKDEEFLCSETKIFQANMEQNLINICQYLNAMLKIKMDDNQKKSLEAFIRLLKFKIASINKTFSATFQTEEETGYEIIHQEVDMEELVKNSSHVASETQKKIENMEESLKLKDEELNLLKEEKEQLCKSVKACGLKIQELEEALITKIDHMQTKLSMESSVSEKYKERCESLQTNLEECQVKLDKARISEEHISNQFREEIKRLKKSLEMEHQAYQNVKDELSMATVKLEKLQVDYEAASELLEIRSRDEKEKIEKIHAENSSKENIHLEKIDHLTTQLLEARELNSESDATVNDLKQKLQLVESKAETIPILQTQLNLLKEEKEQLCETVKASGLRIKELEEGLKTKCDQMRTKLSMESSVSKKYKERCKSLQTNLEECQVKLDKAKISEEQISNQFREEKERLQKFLKKKQEAYQNVKDELSRSTVKLEKLQGDYETESKLLEIRSRDEKEKIEKMQAASLSNEKVHLEKIDQLTAQLLAARELNSESDAVVNDLKQKLQLLEKEVGTIPILKKEIKKMQAATSSNERVHLENIDHLTAQLLEAREHNSESDAVVNDLKKKLQLVERKVETIPILETQIEIYRRDFEIAEKAAEDKVEKLTCELKKFKQQSKPNSQDTNALSARNMSFTSSRKKDPFRDE